MAVVLPSQLKGSRAIIGGQESKLQDTDMAVTSASRLFFRKGSRAVWASGVYLCFIPSI